jgi:tRNA-specific 2-thiouridylase
MKAVVAMSGGLDSSVAAALLKRAGFDLVGVFMKLADLPKFRESEKRAKKIAKILKIPFFVLDLRKEFKKRIVDYFLNEYKKGNTPNPCVVCNKEIKFGLLLEKTLKLNADYVATGHYALKREIKNKKSKIKNYKLLMAKDKNKDQSYFLWMLNQNQLSRILFPIGEYTKKEVENLARKFKLPVLRTKKSVEICFIKTTINDFLKGHLKEKSGNIIDPERKVIGKHQGLYFYTIGQRRGVGLPGGPYWVLDKDLKKNLLIVTKNEKDLLKKELICKNLNWLSGKIPKLPLKIKAKIRYRYLPASATLTYNLQLTTYNLKFEKPQRAITPGQSVVFYRRQAVLGGGIIC